MKERDDYRGAGRGRRIGAAGVAAAFVLALGPCAGQPGFCDSEASSESGGVFATGAESESGGIFGVGAGSESGGVWGTGAESESGGPFGTGAESESGGPYGTGAESESGGPYGTGAESESGGFVPSLGPGYYFRRYLRRYYQAVHTPRNLPTAFSGASADGTAHVPHLEIKTYSWPSSAAPESGPAQSATAARTRRPIAVTGPILGAARRQQAAQ